MEKMLLTFCTTNASKVNEDRSASMHSCYSVRREHTNLHVYIANSSIVPRLICKASLEFLMTHIKTLGSRTKYRTVDGRTVLSQRDRTGREYRCHPVTGVQSRFIHSWSNFVTPRSVVTLRMRRDFSKGGYCQDYSWTDSKVSPVQKRRGRKNSQT